MPHAEGRSREELQDVRGAEQQRAIGGGGRDGGIDKGVAERFAQTFRGGFEQAAPPPPGGRIEGGAPWTWDQVPWPIRSMWMTQLFEQGGRVFGAVTGGLTELFEGLGADPSSFNKAPEELGPGSEKTLPDTFSPISQERSILGLRKPGLGLSR